MSDQLNDLLGLKEEEYDALMNKMGAMLNKYLRMALKEGGFKNIDLINDIKESFKTREEMAIAVFPLVHHEIENHIKEKMATTMGRMLMKGMEEGSESSEQNKVIH